MKNRYCMICGTLLPEDGVCLRCGAKYQLADDGQLIVIPRKVKKVSAKITPKKRFTVKEKQEPSEAETQTIPILEDVYSFSDEAKSKAGHVNWTGNTNPKELEKQSTFSEAYDKGEKGISDKLKPEDSQVSAARIKPKMVSTKTLIALLLLTAMLSTGLVYELWRRSDNSRKANTISAISSTYNNGNSTSSTQFENTKKNTFDAPTFIYYQGGESIEALYTYKPETCTLTIDHYGMDYSGFYLLPLVDYKDNRREPLIPLSIWSIGDCPVLGFLFSDWITSGIIERIIVNSSYSENGNSERRREDYYIKAEQGLVQQVERTMDYYSNFQSGESGASHETTTYTFDYNKEKTLVSETILFNTNGYQDKDQRTFSYDENGYLKSIDIEYSQNQDGTYLNGVIEVTKDALGRIVSINQSFGPEEEGPPIGYDYSYNEAGYITKVVSHEAPVTIYLEYDSNGRVKSATYVGQ